MAFEYKDVEDTDIFVDDEDGNLRDVDVDPRKDEYNFLPDVDPKKVVVVEDIVIEEAYRKQYPNLSDYELKKYLARFNGCYRDLPWTAGFLNEERETEKSRGVKGIHSQPLVQVLSASVESDDESLAVYGEIEAQFWYCQTRYERQLYSRKKTAPQLIGTSAVLALNVDEGSKDYDYACMPLSQNKENRIVVNLYDSKGGNDFARQSIKLDDDIEGYGYDHQVVVRSKHIPSRQSGAGLTLRYAVIPFGVSVSMRVYIFSRKSGVSSSPLVDVDVSGSIFARYAASGERVQLYDKPEKEAQRVRRAKEPLQLSSSWVAAPAYSSLAVDVDLSIVGPDDEEIKVVKGAVELLPGLFENFVVADHDYYVLVEHAWYSPHRHWMSTEIQSEEKVIPCIQSTESLDENELPMPCPDTGVEIFSVFLGRERPMAAQVHGSIEVLPFSIFKADAKEALTLDEDTEFIPVSDGSRLPYDISEMIKVDIKDVEGFLAVKGYIDWWDWEKEKEKTQPSLLCYFFRGQHGFVAVHYAVFSFAIEANIKLVLKSKTRVSGSVIAQLSCFDYPSKYDTDFYRIVLFRSGENHSVQLGADCTMPLSRSKVVVPSNSSLFLKVDLSFEGDLAKKMSEEIEVRPNSRDIESSDGALAIRVDWRRIE